jgi:hypothetical protein
MDKKIIAHQKLVEKRLMTLEKQPDKVAARELLDYHDIMTRNFQHERQIHLFVTLFFAALLVAVAVTAMILPNALPAVMNSPWLNLSLAALAVLLLVLELFYIWHYYRLENRTQKLYNLTLRIYKLLS